MTDDTDKKDPLKLARDRLARCIEAEQENRKHAKDALEFRALKQWPDTIKNSRENDPDGARPCLVVDKTNQYINQVKNDQRQNRPSIKVRPVDDQGDPEIAEIYQGIVRHIEDTSKADLAYDTSFEHALDGGFGYFRILTEYCDETSFDQDIKIKRIRNRFSVYLDPDRQEPDGSDAKFGFIVDEISRDEHKAQFPGKDLVDFKDADESIKDWHQEKKVRIAEYFFYRPKEVEIALLEDGSVIREDDENYEPKGLKVIKTRKTTINEVVWQKINGKEVLEEKVWPGKFIPIVEVIGNELDIEGKRITSGMLKSAMDSQRIYNYAASSFVENVALAPKAPFVGAEGQFEGYEDDWRSANRRNLSALTYKPTTVDGHLVPAPQRQPPPGISAGWLQVMQNSEQGIQGSLGMYQASVGAPSNEKSGKAILARQREGDTATFHYIDNLSRSIRHAGRIIVDLIPKIYDTQRVVRILGEDGEPDHAKINPDQKVPVQEIRTGEGIKKIYNLGVGKYDVTVSVGPSYTTKRQEAAEAMVQILQGNPELMQTIGDLAFKSMDFPGADEIAERLKKLLPPQLQETDEEGQGGLSPEAQAMIQQLQQQLEQAMAAAEGTQAELELKAAEVKIKEFEAETRRMQVMGTLQGQSDEMEQKFNVLAETLADLIAKQSGKQPEAA
jgi:hypothetical protein